MHSKDSNWRYSAFSGAASKTKFAPRPKEKSDQPTLPVNELFRLWVRGRILEGEEPGWDFHLLRMADRRRLFRDLGLDPDTISLEQRQLNVPNSFLKPLASPSNVREADSAQELA